MKESGMSSYSKAFVRYTVLAILLMALVVAVIGLVYSTVYNELNYKNLTVCGQAERVRLEQNGFGKQTQVFELRNEEVTFRTSVLYPSVVDGTWVAIDYLGIPGEPASRVEVLKISIVTECLD